jgi:gas vesicle protein
MTDKNGDLLKGLFVGGLIGAALGIMFAPKSGKKTREEITRKANEMLVKAKEEYEKAAEKSKLVYEASLKHLQDLNVSAKEKAGEIENKVGELAQQGAGTIQSNKNRLKKALDAGMEAYREESTKKNV